MDHLPTPIESLEDIQRLAQAGITAWEDYGAVTVTRHGDLLLFAQSPLAQQLGRWNFFERVAGGLILNQRTGEIVARPFDKLFYWLEGGRISRGHLTNITEKLDGTLGILYRHKERFWVATKGQVDSEQAEFASEFLRQAVTLDDLAPQWTLLFEIIYPANRMVVDYGEREDVVLLAARNRWTGDYMPAFPDLYELAQYYGFSQPRRYDFNNVGDLLEATSRNETGFEGWVAEFSDGQRFKFRLDRYIESYLALRKTERAFIPGAVGGGQRSPKR